MRTNQSWDSAEVTENWSVLVRSIRPDEYHNEFTHQIWTQSDHYLDSKCTETDQSEARKQCENVILSHKPDPISVCEQIRENSFD